MTSLEHASLEWDEAGQPQSSVFGDVYFSRANGLLETRHVFLHHNQLAERFSTLRDGEIFAIGETGFGSGLNFLAACELFLKVAPKNCRLHFVSVEKFPLTPQDLARALALWPELSALSQELIINYPSIASNGFYRLNLLNHRVHLTLLIDDAAQGFEQLLVSDHPNFIDQGCKIDAWFLDGFAPSKNPEMWSDRLFDAIAYLSREGTTAATFSAAGIVKKGLIRAGFTIEKVPGFGKKREMVKAFFKESQSRYSSSDESSITTYNQLAAARASLDTFKSSMPYASPWPINKGESSRAKEVVIVGAGISGCHTARALAVRGWKVRVVDKNSKIAQGASGNPQGILYAKLSYTQEVQAVFNEAALQFSMHFYNNLWPLIGSQCGVIQLAVDEKEQQLHSLLKNKYSKHSDFVEFIDAEKASDLASTHVPFSGIYFPKAGWINPHALCEHLLDHPNIQVINDCDIKTIENTGSEWLLKTATTTYSAPQVVLATAESSQQFLPTELYPFKAIRGQVTYLDQSEARTSLATVVCGKGYVAPTNMGFFTTGATFNLRMSDLTLRKEDHETNISNLVSSLPEFLNLCDRGDHHEFEGRAAFRCSLPDYLPMVGPIADATAMVERFDKLRKNSNAPIHEPGVYLEGLFVNAGHGSRGLAYAPLAAELLACQMNGEPLPVSRKLATALHPARFIIRNLIRNK